MFFFISLNSQFLFCGGQNIYFCFDSLANIVCLLWQWNVRVNSTLLDWKVWNEFQIMIITVRRRCWHNFSKTSIYSTKSLVIKKKNIYKLMKVDWQSRHKIQYKNHKENTETKWLYQFSMPSQKTLCAIIHGKRDTEFKYRHNHMNWEFHLSDRLLFDLIVAQCH